MKSFRVYVAPGRVPTMAGWIAIAAGVATVILGVAYSNIWARVPVPQTPQLMQLKWVLVLSGVAVFGIIGGVFKLAGKPLSKPEKD